MQRELDEFTQLFEKTLKNKINIKIPIELQKLQEEKKKLEQKKRILDSEIYNIDEKIYNYNRSSIIDKYQNIPIIRLIEPNQNILPEIKDKKYLIGVKSNNCNVTLIFGKTKIPIYNKNIYCRIDMYYPSSYDIFDIIIEPIIQNQDYSIELKYTDDTLYTNVAIRDIENNEEIAIVVQVYNSFVVKLPTIYETNEF